VVGWNHVERMRIEFPPLVGADLRVDALSAVADNLSDVLARIFVHP
jgi:hypothetical protein